MNILNAINDSQKNCMMPFVVTLCVDSIYDHALYSSDELVNK